jgi:type IV pilus assembly protein PilC
MAAFSYKVRDARGQEFTGTIEAESEQSLRTTLTDQGYVVAEIKRARGGGRGPKISRFKRVKLNDLAQFCRQFATMINAGVSLVRCLTVLQEQTTNPNLRAIIAEVRSDVEGGNTLSGAMAKYQRTFSDLAIGLVRAGEVGGVLDETLSRLAGFLEKDVELRRKVKSAMTYPTIVMVAAVGIVFFLMTFILPKFMDLFDELGIGRDKMPAPTLMLRNISEFMRNNILLTLGIGIALFIAVKMVGRTKMGRRYIDLVKLKIPVMGKLTHKVALARFSSTLSTLLSSGVPILQAMETVAGTVGNSIISEAVMDARAAVREGDEIGAPLKASGLFPPMVVQMISIGEETGSLDAMLLKVSEFYESEVDTALQQLTAAIEPVLIVFLGGVVGFIVVSMFLPLVEIINQLSGEDSDS